MNHTDPITLAQQRVTAAADGLETLDGHLARYVSRPIALATHLADSHKIEAPAHVDMDGMEARHADAHIPGLLAAGRELDAAEAALALAQAEAAADQAVDEARDLAVS
jgi:hypothetical protein